MGVRMVQKFLTPDDFQGLKVMMIGRLCLYPRLLASDHSRLRLKLDYRLGWSFEYVRKSMHASHSVSVACKPAETSRRRGDIGSVHMSFLVGNR